MTKQILKAFKRSVLGRKVKTLRSKGLSPANIFGNKIPSLNISVETKPFQKLFTVAGESTLVYLEVEGEKETRPVFVRDVVKHSVSGDILHVVFHQVNLKEKVLAPVPVQLVGEPQAEKDKLGIMVQQLDELEIKALPTDMPEHIQIDVTSLAEVGAHIKVADLNLDSKLEVQTDPDTTIVQIEALAKEEAAPVVAPTTPEGEAGVTAEEGEKAASADTEKESTAKEKSEEK